jgi:NADPH:quinone reductase-like Zn-dependent oxidoreductase
MTTPRNARIVITAIGGPEVLKWVEEDAPFPGPGQVRVRVLSAGVAYADILMRRGLYPGAPKLPLTPGYDIVGEIDSLGDGVSGFRPGQHVAALTMIGGYSRFLLIPAAQIVSVPGELDPAEAVALVLNYVTAYQMLYRIAKIRSGQYMLVHSAAGGVGTAALQLGRIADLRMFGTASRPKHELISSFGATPIDYRSEDFVERIRELAHEGLDAVLDPIGGTNWPRSYSLLKRGGHLVCYGVQVAVSKGQLAAGLGFLFLGASKLLPDGKHAAFFNAKTLHDTHFDWFREDLMKLFDLLSRRQIQPVIAAKFSLRDAGQANALLEGGNVSGKLVLLCQE